MHQRCKKFHREKLSAAVLLNGGSLQFFFALPHTYAFEDGISCADFPPTLVGLLVADVGLMWWKFPQRASLCFQLVGQFRAVLIGQESSFKVVFN